MAKEWRLPRPRVILSIVSGTKSYGKYGKDKTVETAMQEGLVKAMKTTQVRIIETRPFYTTAGRKSKIL